MGNSFEDGISWLLRQPIPSWNISELVNSHSFIQQVFLSTNTLWDRCSARLPPGNIGVTRLSPCRHEVYIPVRRRGKKKNKGLEGDNCFGKKNRVRRFRRGDKQFVISYREVKEGLSNKDMRHL